jgi:Kef-type K+ transport system membrane component KefB
MEQYTGVLLLIISVLISPYFSKVTKLPISIIEIIFGALIIYIGIYKPTEFIQIIADFGFYYLMFLVGMEIKLTNLKNLKWSNVLMYIFILNALSVLIVFLFNLNYFYLMIFPLMSVGMLKILSKENKDEWISFAIITGIVGEFFSIIILTILESFNLYGYGIELLENLIKFAILLILFVVLLLTSKKILDKYPETLKIIMPVKDSNSESFRIGFFLIILFIGIMKVLHFEMALGAFFAGFFITNIFIHKEEVLKHRFSSLGFGLFIPVFFVNIGTQLDLTYLASLGFLLDVLKILIITISIHFISVQVFAKKFIFKDRMLFALSHSMPLTLLIVFSAIGTKMQILNNYENNVLITAAITEVILSFSIIKFFLSFDKKDDIIKN